MAVQEPRPESRLDFHTRHMVDTIDILIVWTKARTDAFLTEQNERGAIAKALQLHGQLDALKKCRSEVIKAAQPVDLTADTPTQGD